ncbi:MAG TPA: hypothetical protein VK212_03415 [Lentimicrobium sp.]|nr:hypothetical protein [Lentimicrobium sp.]
MHIEYFNPKEEIESECDTVVHINISGNIKCKLVFEQSRKDRDNKKWIEIPSTKTDINDNSVLCSKLYLCVP